MVQIRIKLLTLRIDSLQPLFRQPIPHLRANHLETFSIIRILRRNRPRQRAIKRVQHRQHLFNRHFDPALAVLRLFFLHPLLEIFKIRLPPHQRVHHFLFFRLQLLQRIAGKAFAGNDLRPAHSFRIRIGRSVILRHSCRRILFRTRISFVTRH